MATTSDGPYSLRARYTLIAATYLNEHKRNGEHVAVAVEPARLDGWTVVVKSGDVGASGRLGPDPSDDELRGILAVLLADARELAVLGDDITERRNRGYR